MSDDPATQDELETPLLSFVVGLAASIAWAYLLLAPETWPLSDLDVRWAWGSLGVAGVANANWAGQAARRLRGAEGWSPRTLGAVAWVVVGAAVVLLSIYRIAQSS